MSEYSIKVQGSSAKVYTPYNPDFVRKIKLMGGRWDAATKAWSVPVSILEDVRSTMRSVYGRDDSIAADLDLVKVKVTYKVDDWSANQSSYIMYGRVIARAWGRDSGAKTGDGVHFVAGKCDSGGSMKNWHTIIREGSVVIIDDVPRSIFEATPASNDYYDAEIAPAAITIDRDALAVEKEKLLARIAEIDKLLA